MRQAHATINSEYQMRAQKENDHVFIYLRTRRTRILPDIIHSNRTLFLIDNRNNKNNSNDGTPVWLHNRDNLHKT